MRKTTLITILFFLTLAVFAAQPAQPSAVTQAADAGYLSEQIKSIESPKAQSGPGILSTLLNLVLSLLFVIGLIYLVMLGIKYFYVKASIPMKSENVVTVLAKEYLDNKRVLYIVEFGGKVLMIGAGAEEMSLITEIKEPEAVKEIKDRADEYIAKYRMKNEFKFAEQLKNAYLRQGKRSVDSGNKLVQDLKDKINKTGEDGKQ